MNLDKIGNRVDYSFSRTVTANGPEHVLVAKVDFSVSMPMPTYQPDGRSRKLLATGSGWPALRAEKGTARHAAPGAAIELAAWTVLA